MGFDYDRRRCTLSTLYRRPLRSRTGAWLEYPSWVDDLAAAALAEKKEVRSWVRSLDMRLSA